MANTITKTTLLNGARNLVVLVNITGDASGDETDLVLIDRSDYDDGTELVVEKICGHIEGFIARLDFDATTNLTLAHLPDGHLIDYDWCSVGGVSSHKAGAGANGDLLLTTSGLGAERGTFTLFMRKA